MSTFEIKQTVFKGIFPPSPGKAAIARSECLAPEKPARYWALAQSRADLRDPDNSPSVSMWGFLLASAQTQRLNEISVYVGHGTSAEDMRFLYLNDFALTIWRQMNKPVRVTGRVPRPPRTAVLCFGMPYSE